MARLVPALTVDIPASLAAPRSDVHRLVVEKHEFLAPSEPVKNRLAFVFSHANGFHKEMLHPLMKLTIESFRKQSQYNQTQFDFYAFDARNHGDSARLNEATLHIPTYSWFDHAMDTIQVIEELELKENYNKVIGVGHSFGGSAMILAEFMFPKTFDGLCIPEPVLAKVIAPYLLREQSPPIQGSLKRRDEWKSREDCFKAFEGRPFWRDLHPDVLQNYINYGMYDTPEGTVKLKCPKLEEYLVYMAGVYGSASAFGSLRSLSIPVHIVHAKDSTFTDPDTAEEIKAQSPMLTNTVVEGSHMVPGENPAIIVPEIEMLTARVLAQDAALRAHL